MRAGRIAGGARKRRWARRFAGAAGALALAVVCCLVALPALDSRGVLDASGASGAGGASGASGEAIAAPADAATASSGAGGASGGGAAGVGGAGEGSAPDGPGPESPAPEGDEGDASDGVGEVFEDLDLASGNYQVSDDQTLQESLDRYISANYKAAGLPGIAVAVVSSDEVLYVGTFGDCTSPLDTFEVGSLSKSFTAVAIMQLKERGFLDLDDPANLYIPDSTLPDSVTIRALLNQTSGFGYYDSLGDASVGPSEGTFAYANANYDMLGLIIENVSGMSYAEYLDENIFGPLGMTGSSADPSARSQVLGHRNYFGIPVTDGFVHQDTADSWGQSPSGYICSNIEDMGRYLQMYLRNGEGVLSSESVDEMFWDVVPASDDGDSWYSMGWMPLLDEADEVMEAGHPGQVENAVADMRIFPQKDLAVIILGDESDYFGGNDQFWEMAGQIEGIVDGYDAFDIDPSTRIDQHLRVDGVLLVLVVLCLLPILLSWRWRRMMQKARGTTGALRVWLPLVLIHFVAPMVLSVLPGQWGIKWRDLTTFVPDIALVLFLCIALLLGCGIVKVCLVLGQYRRNTQARNGNAPHGAA